MFGGRPETLDGILAGIERGMTTAREARRPGLPDAEGMVRLVGRLRELHAAGFVFMHLHPDELAGLVCTAEREDKTEAILALERARAP
jgi:hypothetical protein